MQRSSDGPLATALFLFYMIAGAPDGCWRTAIRAAASSSPARSLWEPGHAGKPCGFHGLLNFYLRQALVGIGEASFRHLRSRVLSDFYPERERNRILSVFYLAIPVGASLGYLAGGQIGPHWGWRAPFLVCAIPGLLIAAFYGWFGTEPSAAPAIRILPTVNRSTFSRPVHQSRLPDRHLRPGRAHLRHGRPSPTGFRPFCTVPAGLSVGRASLVVGAITVVDGIGGNAHRRLDCPALVAHRSPRPLPALLLERRSHAALRTAGLLRATAWAIPSLFAAEFFLFLKHRPTQRGDCELGLRTGPRYRHRLHLFIIHCFGDTFSPQIIGYLSDRVHSLRMALGATLIALVVSGVILRAGARFAPALEDPASGF